ncbi:MAG: SPFH domain-containing protein [Candidatus Eisenbacteria bacterium]|uniref:SPFH domain-containing protein n=1 Tax=Eiseniibacteriota bacterium TaxID=2212470 RepID=A0A538TV34_UNCEI|nr:MAG: SPFH domain-containing protein [Candidatus Eisenbacteria bacterium]
MLREKTAGALPGVFMLVVLLAGFVFPLWWLIAAARAASGWSALGASLTMVIDIILVMGFVIVNPNQAQVVTLFGNYVGSLRAPGLWWVNPFSVRRRVSLRVRNFESSKLKVNDHDGNPIEIAAVIVWRVVDSAEAMFEVDSYENFVHVQCEAALRNLATSYPYDAHVDGQWSLRAQTAEIADQLRTEVQARLDKAGVQVIESRISHLAYAPEIAGAMLRRQQASAIVAARQKLVEGAVGMVEMALDQLSRKNVVALDDERKAAMVSNMLVVLCSDQHTQPVVNTGTLYT